MINVERVLCAKYSVQISMCRASNPSQIDAGILHTTDRRKNTSNFGAKGDFQLKFRTLTYLFTVCTVLMISVIIARMERAAK